MHSSTVQGQWQFHQRARKSMAAEREAPETPPRQGSLGHLASASRSSGKPHSHSRPVRALPKRSDVCCVITVSCWLAVVVCVQQGITASLTSPHACSCGSHHVQEAACAQALASCQHLTAGAQGRPTQSGVCRPRRTQGVARGWP